MEYGREQMIQIIDEFIGRNCLNPRYVARLTDLRERYKNVQDLGELAELSREFARIVFEGNYGVQ